VIALFVGKGLPNLLAHSLYGSQTQIAIVVAGRAHANQRDIGSGDSFNGNSPKGTRVIKLEL
jgi:hypothetical protein